MTLTITDTAMTSDLTDHRARQRDDGRWCVTWCPAQVLTHNQAITAMSIAERVDQGAGERDPLVQDWASELDMSADEAVSRLIHDAATEG